MPLSVVLTLSFAVLLAAPALAKSPPDRLSVEGPGLAAPVEITGAAELATFSPWGRGFIDWDRGQVPAPPPADQTYTVSFFLGGRKIYVVHYIPAPTGGSGYIYIPGPGDPDYRLNIGTIMGASSSDRWDPDGKWQHSTAAWDAAIQRAVRAHAAPPPTPISAGQLAPSTASLSTRDARATPIPAVSMPRLWPVAATTIGLLGSLAWVVWRRHRRPTA